MNHIYRTFVTFIISLLHIVHICAQHCDTITATSVVPAYQGRLDVLNAGEGHNTFSSESLVSFDDDSAVYNYVPLIKSLNLWATSKNPLAHNTVATGIGNAHDWSPGPYLEVTDAQVLEASCSMWDRTFDYTIEDVALAISVYENNLPCHEIPASIRTWPAKGNTAAEVDLSNIYSPAASFYDRDHDGVYDACKGDLPYLPIHQNIAGSSILNYVPRAVSYHLTHTHTSPDLLESYEMPLQVGTYVCSFHDEKLRDVVMIFNKIVSTGHDAVKDWHMSYRIAFDMGCPDDVKIGSYPDLDMVYAYFDENGESCTGHSRSRMVAFATMKGLTVPKEIASINGTDTLLQLGFSGQSGDTLVEVRSTSVVIPTDCDNPVNDCDVTTAEAALNIAAGLHVDGTPMTHKNGQEVRYQFSGTAGQNQESMCDSAYTPQGVAYLNVGDGGTLQPGAHSIMISSLISTRGIECQWPGLMRIKHQESRIFVDLGLHQNIGPPAPMLTAQKTNGLISLSVSDIPYDYSDQILHPLGEKYIFEGIKIFQVKSRDFNISHINNLDYARIVYQGDIANTVTDLYNWIAIQATPPQYYPLRQVIAANVGITEKPILIDRDAFTGSPITDDEDYHFLAISYGYNNYQQYDQIEDEGQRYPYIQSSFGYKVVTAESANATADVDAYSSSIAGSTLHIESIIEPLSVRLYAMDGREVFSQEVVHASRVTIATDGLNLPSGIYIYTISGSSSDAIRTYKVFIP